MIDLGTHFRAAQFIDKEDADTVRNAPPECWILIYSGRIEGIFGLADSRDRWHFELKGHMKENLKMEPLKGDQSLYCKHIAERLVGMSSVFVDDLLEAGYYDFQEFTECTGRRFDSLQRKYGSARFIGMEFDQAEKSKFL